MSNEGNSQVEGRLFRVLIANDQEWTARSLESILVAEGHEIVRAYTGRQAFDRAIESAPDLIILDTQLPDISGPEVCRMLREDRRIGWGTPIVLTTAGSNGRARQTEVFDVGAWDFWTQPFDGPLLLLKTRTFLRARSQQVAARESALLDATTGLYNATGLSLRLGELAVEARRRREQVTCVVLSAGSPELSEAVLAAEDQGRTIGKAVRAVIRGSDVVGRLSALDFVVAASGLSREGALQMVERFQRAVAGFRPDGAPAIPLRAGIATLEDNPAESPEEVFRQAMAAASLTAVRR